MRRASSSNSTQRQHLRHSVDRPLKPARSNCREADLRDNARVDGRMGARRRRGTPGVAFLQTFDTLLQPSVIACSVVPEAGMPGSHHPNLCAANATHLLINNSRSDNRTVDRRHRSVLLSKPNEKNTNRIDSLIAGVETGPTNGKMPRVGRQKLSAVDSMSSHSVCATAICYYRTTLTPNRIA